MTLEGRSTIEGEGSGRVTGLRSQHVEIAMLGAQLGLRDQARAPKRRCTLIPGRLIKIGKHGGRKHQQHPAHLNGHQ
jgi:hypothetical protein